MKGEGNLNGLHHGVNKGMRTNTYFPDMLLLAVDKILLNLLSCSRNSNGDSSNEFPSLPQSLKIRD